MDTFERLMRDITTLEKELLKKEKRQEERKQILRGLETVFVATMDELKWCISIGIGNVVLVSDKPSINDQMAMEAGANGITAILYSQFHFTRFGLA